MEKFLYIIAMGFAGAYIAKKRKLNPFFWFAVCSIPGLISLGCFIYLLFFQKKRKAPPSIKEEVSPTSFFPLETIWYYLDENETQVGPMSFARLLEVKKAEIIDENNYIWNESFTEWKLWTSVFPKEKP